MLGVGHMQTKGGSFVTIAAAVRAKVFPDFRVVELHDGKTRVLLHKLPSETAGSYIHRDCRTVVT